MGNYPHRMAEEARSRLLVLEHEFKQLPSVQAVGYFDARNPFAKQSSASTREVMEKVADLETKVRGFIEDMSARMEEAEELPVSKATVRRPKSVRPKAWLSSLMQAHEHSPVDLFPTDRAGQRLLEQATNLRMPDFGGQSLLVKISRIKEAGLDLPDSVSKGLLVQIGRGDTSGLRKLDQLYHEAEEMLAEQEEEQQVRMRLHEYQGKANKILVAELERTKNDAYDLLFRLEELQERLRRR